jgi:hypothetical protein
MAKIISGNFIVDIQFADYSNGEIHYHLRLTYGGLQIINPELMGKDYFLNTESGKDTLLEGLGEGLCLSQDGIIWDTDDKSEFNFGISVPMAQSFREDSDNFLSPEEDIFTFKFIIHFAELKRIPGIKEGAFIGDIFEIPMVLKRSQFESIYDEMENEYMKFCKKFNINDPRNELSKQFDQRMLYISAKSKRYGFEGGTFLSLIKEYGGQRAAQILIDGSESSSKSMFEKLQAAEIWTNKALNLSVEQLVSDPKWKSLFTKDQIKIAKERIAKWGLK